MKKLLFLVFLLAGCTYQQTVSSNSRIDSNAKTVAIDSSNFVDIHQDFKQILSEAGFKIYNQNNRGYMARYELADNINKDNNVRCGIFEDGYSYDITFKDMRKGEEVFSIEGKGCREAILRDFTALVNNRYDEKPKDEQTPKNPDDMQAPTLRSDGRTWWSN